MLCRRSSERTRHGRCSTPPGGRSLPVRMRLRWRQLRFAPYGAQQRLANRHSAFRENRTSSVKRKGRFREWRSGLWLIAAQAWLVLPLHSWSLTSPESDFGMRTTKENVVRFTVKFESGPVVRRGACIEHHELRLPQRLSFALTTAKVRVEICEQYGGCMILKFPEGRYNALRARLDERIHDVVHSLLANRARSEEHTSELQSLRHL